MNNGMIMWVYILFYETYECIILDGDQRSSQQAKLGTVLRGLIRIKSDIMSSRIHNFIQIVNC